MALCIDVSGILRTIWHSVVLGQYVFAMYYDINYVEAPKHLKETIVRPGMGGRSRFLTYWCLIIQAVYFSVCLYNDFCGTNEVVPKKKSPVRKFRDYLMATFAFPLAMNVGVSFWALMAIDRELILPKSFDEFFPSWLNHVMHTNIVVFIFLEMCTTFRQYPSRKESLTGLSLFMLAYLIWIHIIKSVSGKWVYPVLDVLNFPQRIVFFIVILTFGLSFYFLGEYINNKVWANELRQIKSNERKQRVQNEPKDD